MITATTYIDIDDLIEELAEKRDLFGSYEVTVLFQELGVALWNHFTHKEGLALIADLQAAFDKRHADNPHLPEPEEEGEEE